MDMSNATAAGPSRGLLDVIFGSKQEQPEEANADGQGFGNLMNLIKVLNMKKEAEVGTDAGRTPGETLLGKSIAEGNADGMPSLNGKAVPLTADGQLEALQKLQEAEEKEKLQRLALLGIPAAALMVPVPPAQQLEGVQPELVNQALRQKGLPPLSQQEMKLLQDVNGKISQANGAQSGQVEIPPELMAAGVPAVDPALLDPSKAQALPKVAAPNGQALDPQLQKAMAEKGTDPRKLKAVETSADGGTPEKIMTTESYLQMYESVNAGAKPQVKEPGAKGSQAAGAEQSAVRAPDGALTAGAVAEASQKGLGSRQGDGADQLPKGAKQTKLDATTAGTFGATLSQKNEAAQKDLYLPAGQKPEQLKSALTAELGTNVAFHANKGGGEMRIVLHPDDMGEVKLKVGTKNGKVEVQVTADNEDVAKLLRGGSKDLEASLKSQNLSLSKFEVTVGDSSSLVATDTRSGLNEQFLGQNSQHQGGFTQANADDNGRNARWGGEQGARQGGGYSAFAEDAGRGFARGAASSPKTMARAMDSSRRLDVVA
ncbi:MAG: flagellar hook-length control protein FliK [Bdellovibrionota bacterium]